MNIAFTHPRPGCSLPHGAFDCWDKKRARFRIGHWLLVGFVVLMTGCAEHPQSAVLTPARTSNTATRQSIKEVRADIKFSQAKAAAGATALQKADANLTQLLAVEPRTARVRVTPLPIPAPVATPTPTPAVTPKPRALFNYRLNRTFVR